MERMPSAFRHHLLVDRAKFLAGARLTTPQLDRELHAKRLFTVELQGQDYLPAFFLDGRYERRQLQAICKVLGDLPGGSKLQFFTTPKGSLSGQTPLDALLERKAAAVRRTAQGFVER
jgi:hypothetical protein